MRTAQQLAVFASLGDGIVLVTARSLQLCCACALIAQIESRARLLNACLDFNALVFAEPVNPSEVAAAIFPIAILNGIVIKDGIPQRGAIGVVGAIVPVAFLEKSRQCNGLLVAYFVIKTGSEVITPAPRVDFSKLLRDCSLPIVTGHLAINSIANFAIPLEQRNGQGHVEGANRFTD